MKKLRKLKSQAPLTLEQAKALQYGDMLYTRIERNKNGGAMKFRVNGKPQIWKTRTDEVSVPVKHGLYHYGYVTQENADMFSLESGE